MLTRIVLRNFQKHKKLDLRLEKITTLVGSSDAGKSAVIRALRWVVTNLPKGTSFIRNGASRCSVTIWIDGHKIRRTRDKENNTYELDGQVFRSFTTGVPEAIQQVLRLGVENFQQQHDPIFWLSMSPAEVSKKLNEISDLQIMDDSLRRSVSLKKEAEQRVKIRTADKKEADATYRNLRNVPAMSEAFAAIQSMERKLLSVDAQVARLRTVIDTAEETTAKAAILETAALEARKLVVAEEKIEVKWEKFRQLSKYVKQIEKFGELRPMQLDEQFEDLAEVKRQKCELSQLVLQIKSHQKEIDQCSKQIQTLSESAEIRLCPTCFRPIETKR